MSRLCGKLSTTMATKVEEDNKKKSAINLVLHRSGTQ